MMRLFDWLFPDPIRLQPVKLKETVEDGIITYQFTALPYVSYVSHRSVRLWPEGVALLRHHGYREVSRDILSRSEIVARPLPLWLFYRGVYKLTRAWWWTVTNLYDVGVFNVDSVEEGVRWEWKDIRPGPSRAARSFYKEKVRGFIQRVRRFK